MDNTQNILQKFAIKVSDWSEKWFPDSYIFALLGVIIVAIAAIGIGASVQDVAISFGNGFWSLIPFTMQMCMLIVVGYVVSVSKPVEMLIQKMAQIPTSGRNAIVFVATVSLLISLINWAMSTVLTALLVIALSKRKELNMDYRAAAAAAIIGMGATWALGISSSAAQLQANKALSPANVAAASLLPPPSPAATGMFLVRVIATPGAGRSHREPKDAKNSSAARKTRLFSFSGRSAP